MRCVLLLIAAIVGSGVSSRGDDRIALKVLYSGNPGSDRMSEFQSFLEQHFTHVTVTNTSTFKESEADDFDVVVFDWTRTFDDNGTLKTELRLQDPPRLSREFSKPAVLIGETGGRLTAYQDLKLDWMCLCLYDSAHHLNLSHQVFHQPLEVAPVLEEISTPEDYPLLTIEPLESAMTVWKTQTVNFPQADVGMCHTLYGFGDSPDAEVFARGNSMKGPDCVALSRHGNYFHWGFSVAPPQMTASAQRLFINAICYIDKFDGQLPVVRKTAIPREYALRYAMLPRFLTDEYRAMKDASFRDQIAKSSGLLPAQYEGNIERFIADQLNWVEPEMQRVLPADLLLSFGNDAAKWQSYYRDNLEYLRPGSSGGTLVVDEDVMALGISNRDPQTLDHCIKLLDNQQDKDRALRILKRYTGLDYESAADWKTWFEANKASLYFTDGGGYQFLIRE